MERIQMFIAQLCAAAKGLTDLTEAAGVVVHPAAVVPPAAAKVVLLIA